MAKRFIPVIKRCKVSLTTPPPPPLIAINCKYNFNVMSYSIPSGCYLCVYLIKNYFVRNIWILLPSFGIYDSNALETPILRKNTIFQKHISSLRFIWIRHMNYHDWYNPLLTSMHYTGTGMFPTYIGVLLWLLFILQWIMVCSDEIIKALSWFNVKETKP